jgi:hypothetical protein
MAWIGHSPQDVHVMPSDLSEPERAEWSAFPHGGWVDLRSGDAAEDNVRKGEAWGARRAVRAEVIRALLLGACPAEPGYTAALCLRGARVAGCLDLPGGTLDYALACEECFLDSPLCLADPLDSFSEQPLIDIQRRGCRSGRAGTAVGGGKVGKLLTQLRR